MDYIDVNQHTFNALASEYAARRENYIQKDTQLLQPLIARVGKHPTVPHILELGPGGGAVSKILAGHGFNTTAIDVASKMIAAAKVYDANTKYIHGEFLAHHFDQQYDAIVAVAFLHLFPKHDAIKVLEKIADLLVPNGIFFVSITIHESSSEDFEKKMDYPGQPIRFRKRWTEQELLAILKDEWTILHKSYDVDGTKCWINLTLAKP